jgi:hypothetical protein
VSIVHCSSCDHVHPATQKEDRPWEWRCLQFPLAAGHGFVAPGYLPSAPYEKCEKANAFGNCNRFTPTRKPAETEPQ